MLLIVAVAIVGIHHKTCFVNEILVVLVLVLVVLFILLFQFVPVFLLLILPTIKQIHLFPIQYPPNNHPTRNPNKHIPSILPLSPIRPTPPPIHGMKMMLLHLQTTHGRIGNEVYIPPLAAVSPRRTSFVRSNVVVGDAAFASRSGAGADVYSIDEGGGRGVDGFGFWGALFTMGGGGRGWIDGYFLAWAENFGGEGAEGGWRPLLWCGDCWWGRSVRADAIPTTYPTTCTYHTGPLTVS
eukprot:CCRYP_017335-RC/>CCRYP_017335-RC protein AED:0.37 eAED:0.54 QI:0/0.5/0.66/1/0.5/0.33/3/1755/239